MAFLMGAEKAAGVKHREALLLGSRAIIGVVTI